jgi:hypothetical protein
MIGATDFKRTDEVERISALMRGVLEHLKDHAQNEETYIHPLFKSLGAESATHLENEHRDLEMEIGKIEKILNEARWDELYSQYTHFLGLYLTHLSEEEAAQKEILWNRYDDQALMAVFDRFKRERSPQAAKADLELMLPALSIPELTRIFLAMKDSAPPQAFQGARELAARVLGPEKWSELRRDCHEFL